MTNPAATRRVITHTADDIKTNTKVVAPQINYAVTEFPDIEERMRFMAMVMLASARRTHNLEPADMLGLIPDAVCDMAPSFVSAPTSHTVH